MPDTGNVCLHALKDQLRVASMTHSFPVSGAWLDSCENFT
ncbi:hypothetical protein BRYFOR_08051 [Marvinbryantia formatexigens DSM 14469]|uniref:Uncharacterized protein n=1 Tax=Marvinbryantia formatexigens DSM 14469 TaxID=478749 RepID=C6LHE0_9FIRM|nr:hypothetical protein BRYFOR_08051 [Marvinbryantia formatexigens DSM 14469]